MVVSESTKPRPRRPARGSCGRAPVNRYVDGRHVSRPVHGLTAVFPAAPCAIASPMRQGGSPRASPAPSAGVIRKNATDPLCHSDLFEQGRPGGLLQFHVYLVTKPLPLYTGPIAP